LLDEVNEQIRAIKDELAAVEAAFKRSAKTAEQLSERVTEPARQRAAEHDRQAAAAAARERRDRARTHLEEVSQRARSAPASESDNVIDRIDSVAAGYNEARHVSDRVLNRPGEFVNVESDADTPPASSRDTVKKAVKFTASAAKWSAAAAKSSAEKFKQ
jgi:HK97 family phage major capsid protein